MRRARIKEQGGAYYHVMSRVIDRQMLLEDVDKECFVRHMHAVAEFSGVQILTHATLTNHFHALVYVPPPQGVSDAELVRRLGFIYEKPAVASIERELRELRAAGQHAAAERLKGRYTYRMHELSEFAKTLKQRFTQSFNDRHGRSGTLWNGRFKSVLVQGSAHALGTIAAYIDLNPMRAGLVRDPATYRFSGYGEAMAGSKTARQGLGVVMASLGHEASWRQVAREYRKWLYLAGEQQGQTSAGRPTKPGFSAQEVKAVLEAGGALPLSQLLRCRVRYFTDGAVLGSRAYVEEVFARHRGYFSRKRRHAARRMLGGGWGDLCTARRLRLAPIRVPSTS